MDLEVELDRFLKIKTNGRDDTNFNFINFPYEPTPYVILQQLGNSGYIRKRDKVIDFGCGKGRVDFFLAYLTRAKMIRVEVDERLYNSALENKKKAISANKVDFIKCCASEYEIEDDVTGAFFFNPFSVEILDKVIKNIKKSKKSINRDIMLYFYYPSKEYREYLEDDCEISFVEEIDCSDLFKEYNERECILVCKL